MDQTKESIKEMLRIAESIERDIHEYKSFDIKQAYKKTEKRINAFPAGLPFIFYFSRIASVLLIPLILSTAILSYLYHDRLQEGMIFYTVTSAPGQITRVDLPDKTEVWLNAGSTLRYPSRFAQKERTVFLHGEGYFSVESDEEHPFYVILHHDMSVKSYGTRFNVNSYDTDSIVEVTLENGRIDFFSDNASSSLLPGEMLTFNRFNNDIFVREIFTDEKTLWREGRLVFRAAALEEVIRSLARRYNIDIVLHRQSTSDYKFRASFTNETITQVLDYMKLAAPIEWKFSKPEQFQDSSFARQRIDIWVK